MMADRCEQIAFVASDKPAPSMCKRTKRRKSVERDEIAVESVALQSHTGWRMVPQRQTIERRSEKSLY